MKIEILAENIVSLIWPNYGVLPRTKLQFIHQHKAMVADMLERVRDATIEEAISILCDPSWSDRDEAITAVRLLKTKNRIDRLDSQPGSGLLLERPRG